MIRRASASIPILQTVAVNCFAARWAIAAAFPWPRSHTICACSRRPGSLLHAAADNSFFIASFANALPNIENIWQNSAGNQRLRTASGNQRNKRCSLSLGLILLTSVSRRRSFYRRLIEHKPLCGKLCLTSIEITADQKLASHDIQTFSPKNGVTAYSWCSATLGSTLIALRVGMIMANRATMATVIATRIKVLGSVGLT